MITLEEQGLSYVQYAADGTTENFMLTMPYLQRENVLAFVDGVETPFTWLNDSEITISPAPAVDTLVTIKRFTFQDSRLVDFQDGGQLRESILDLDSNQLFFLVQEAIDSTAFNLAINSTTSEIDARNNKLINLAAGVLPTDGVNLGQIQSTLDAVDAAVIVANDAAAEAAAAAAVAAALGGRVTTAEGEIDVLQGQMVTAQADIITAQSTANTGVANAATAQAAADAAQISANQGIADAATAQVTADDALYRAQKLQSTGVKVGGILSIGTPNTTFSLTAGEGAIVDQSVYPPVITDVVWTAKVNQPITNLLTQQLTFIAIDASGNVVQSATEFTDTQQRSLIVIGTLIHSTQTTLLAVNQGTHLIGSIGNQLYDLFDSIGNFNISGNRFTANGANLQLDKSAGKLFVHGSNYAVGGTNSPHITSTAGLTACTFTYNNQTGLEGAVVNTLDFSTYDVAGVTTAVPVGKFTVQRVYMFSANTVVIQRGQTVYNSLAEAKAGISTETYVANTGIAANGVLRAFLVGRNDTTSLLNTARAAIIDATKFGGSAGAGSVSTLQNAYENSIEPEITTNTEKGAVGIQRGSAVDTDNVLEIRNGAGSVVAAITGEGNFTGGVTNPTRLDAKKDTLANLTAYAVTATNGQLAYSTDTKEFFVVTDGALVPAGGGGGGVGGVDIIHVQNFEEGLGSVVGDAVAETVDPLSGGTSAKITHAASVTTRFLAEIFPVSDKFRNRTVTMKFNVKSNANAGNVTVSILDDTNTVFLVTGDVVQLSNAVQGEIHQVSFVVPNTCDSLSYSIDCLPQSGAVTVIDDIIFEMATTSLLSTSVEVPVQTSWVDAGTIQIGATTTPPTKGTTSKDIVKWRQVGDTAEFDFTYQQTSSGGVAGSGVYLFTLPNGFQIDTTKFQGNVSIANDNLSNENQKIGEGYIQQSAAQGAAVGVYVYDATRIYFKIGVSTDTTGASNTSAISGDAWGSANYSLALNLGLRVSVKVPCVGLSATKALEIPLAQSVLVQEADSNFQLNGFGIGYASTNTRILNLSSGTVLKNTGDAIQFSQSATLGSSFTAKKKGVYSFNLTFEASTVASVMGLSKNATALSTSITDASLANSRLVMVFDLGGNNIANLNWTGELDENDIVRVHGDGSTLAGNLTYAQLSVTYQGSLKQLNPNPNSKITIPTSELRMEGASTRGSTATAIVRFDNIAKIRGDAFEVLSDATLGTRIVMKKKGKLEVGASFIGTAGNVISITQNQTVLTSAPSASESIATGYSATGGGNATVSTSMFVNVGDVIRVYASAAPTAGSANSLNLSFQEQDISVSVTNTLPQFSESDSSVRVDTANGYGSTGTRIRRFSNVRDNIGNDIEYVPSAVNGDSFVVKSAGVYSISYSEVMAAATDMGISKNASSLTTNIGSLSTSEILAYTSTTNSGFAETVSCQPYLQVGDVIRAHTAGSAASGTNQLFTISKVGKPNVTGVDVTPFVNIPRDEKEVITHSAAASTALDQSGEFRFTLANLSTTNRGIIRIEDDSANSRTRFVALKKCSVDVSFSTYQSSNDFNTILKNGVIVMRGAQIVNLSSGVSGVVQLEAGEFITVGSSGGASPSSGQPALLLIEATAASDSIITANESFSTDTANLVYAPSSLYTLATLNTAPVGTFITDTYAASGNVRTQTTTAPTQTTADMNVNGIRLFARAFNQTSTAASPTRVAIQIGKGLKGRSVEIFKSTTKGTAGSLDYYVSGDQKQGAFTSYNEVTGVLTIDAGYDPNGVSTAAGNPGFLFSDASKQNDGYLVINASKSPALTGVPLLVPRLAILKDAKATTVAGGTATTSYTARILNSIQDPFGIVVNRTSFTGTGGTNTQFILERGTYLVESAATFSTNILSKTRLFNVTAGVSVAEGMSVDAGDTLNSVSSLMSYVEVNTASTFELQASSNVANANGWGNPSSRGGDEIYVQLKIMKIK